MDNRKFKIYVAHILFLLNSAALEHSFYILAQLKFQISISKNYAQFSANLTKLKLIKAAFLESYFSSCILHRGGNKYLS